MSENSESISNIHELNRNQELTLEKNIVWIFGSRRSGTTWLRDLLSFNTKFIRETYVTDHLAVQSQANYFVRRIDEVKDKDNYFFSERYKDTWQYYLGKLLIYRVYADVLDYRHKIIVKEPSSYLDASDIISKCTPLSKKIIILRDGRDVLDSILDGREAGGWLLTNPNDALTKESRIILIEQSARYWVKQVETLLDTYSQLPTDRRFLVHYEELLKNTFTILKKIYAFLEIPITDDEIIKIIDKFDFSNIPADLKGKGKFYRIASPGQWRVNFNENEKQVMHQIMGNLLKKLGYSV